MNILIVFLAVVLVVFLVLFALRDQKTGKAGGRGLLWGDSMGDAHQHHHHDDGHHDAGHDGGGHDGGHH